MKITVVAIGSKMPAWVVTAYQEYARRMPPVCSLVLQEIDAGKRSKNADIARIMRDEARAISAKIESGSLVIALDRQGSQIDTLKLASSMQNWIDQSRDVAIVIGGPEGLQAEFINQADLVWSLSALTFAHPVVRVMLAEQLYRAWSINANLPYHRGE